MKPDFKRLWASFPDHIKYPTLKDLYTMMGGVAQKNIDVPGFGPNGNTCASRISHALNQAGSPINAAMVRMAHAESISDAHGHQVIFKVNDLRKYLRRTLGKPIQDKTLPFDDLFRKKQGIVSFSVDGWGEATGHIALFRCGAYREPIHDNQATYNAPLSRTILSEFWELA